MEIEWVRQHCLSLPNATEQIQWGDNLIFKIGGKMFATLPLEPAAPVFLSFKCAPEVFADLIERPKIIPAPYLSRAHWVSLESDDALPRAEIERLLGEAHALVFAKLPKKLQDKLRHPAKRKKTSRAKD
ncbi:MAG: MmcQ/YjbR family DNA-binding protein [Candidatus Acidiferrales bacterium]